MEESEFSKISRSHEQGMRKINEILQLSHLPQELILETKALLKLFESYDLSQHKDKLKMLKGTVLTVKEAKAALVDASGYTKWTLEPQDEEEDYNGLKEYYAVDFDDTKVAVYPFFRKVNGRDDIYLVTVYCFPGHAYFSYDTRRACCTSDGIFSNNKLNSELSTIF